MFEKINPADNNVEKYPHIEMPETINIDSANELIARLQAIVVEGKKLSFDDIEEGMEMKKILIELQNDLADGDMKSPPELQTAILQLKSVLEGAE